MSIPKKQQASLLNNEYFRQSFRTGKTYQNQQKLSTETSKDAVEESSTPESEFVRPYEWSSYKEMEYFLLSPSGQADAREETPWDTPWTQDQASDARREYYNPEVDGLFYTLLNLLLVPRGSSGLKVSNIG